jgi:diaminopimelate epimerase
MEIPFFKTHAVGNDFLLTWREQAYGTDLEAASRAICERHTGIGADGWMLLSSEPAGADCDASIVLYNADGSVPEMSGNGTRCAAALLLYSGRVSGSGIRIRTGAGVKDLRLLVADGRHFEFEMNMGEPELDDLRFHVPELGSFDAVLVNVGNPQCAVMVDQFPEDWRAIGAALERHPHFPDRTNVSFVRALDEHAIDVRFWERGVGETNSSGTGSTGAAVAAILRGLVKSPVRVDTLAGPMQFRWDDSAYLSGPAEITGSGVYFY